MPSLLRKNKAQYEKRRMSMPNCVICKKPITCGVVLCGHCAKGLEPYTLPTELAYFIDRLADEIVRNDDIYSCSMCAIGNCSSQVSSLTCRNAVKAWLLNQAEQSFPAHAA